jgi:periplasmic divalent cation tolerance protein
MSDSRVLVVLTTTASEAEAVAISRALVEEDLAGCVQRMPISSTYRWQGRVEEGAEYLLIVKTLSDRSEELENRIRELSSYEVPEVVALEATRVAAAYDAWLRSACRDRGRQ